ncbi:MAG: hypothetical protein KBT00_07295 [Bacteroidales bacterium]|nr:hypothetical protein [Candidatus Cacconaster merdequi]
MNIIVVRGDGSYYTRPDTTLEREGSDFYLPDDCEGASASNFRYVRIIKAGKAVAQKFASRYLDKQFGRGVLMYGRCRGCVPCSQVNPYIDYSTILFPSDRDCEEDEISLFSAALSRVSRHTSVRIGDILCLEDESQFAGVRGDTICGVNIL